ncbi:MAG: response regulator transcription factor [Actinomycetota bacterium]|nr:response regulator transcription factor [Actinomycetota bacterium]
MADLAVLVVAGRRIFRDAICTALAETPGVAVCRAAAGPRDAVEDAESVTPDVILLDAGLPDALPAVAAFQGVWPGVRTIVFAASEIGTELLRFAEAGATGFLLREDSLDQVADVIERIGRGEAVFPPTLAAALLTRLATPAPRLPDSGTLRLTTRELEVARLLADGVSNKEIARRLHIELATVKNHVHNILRKLQVSRRTEIRQVLGSISGS